MQRHTDSYSDFDAYLFYKKGVLYRFLKKSYLQHFKVFKASGLYSSLIEQQLILPFKQIKQSEDHIIIKPNQLDFVSQPTQWSLPHLMHVAHQTLKIQKLALNYNMTLKDAAAHNFTFVDDQAILIDTTSFEQHDGVGGWKALKQFIEQFIVPAFYHKYFYRSIKSIFLEHRNGIDLAKASAELPLRSWLNIYCLLLIHLPNKIKHRKSSGIQSVKKQLKIIRFLEDFVTYFKVSRSSLWREYTLDNHSDAYFDERKAILSSILEKVEVKSALDIGANTGMYTSFLNQKTVRTIGVEQDAHAVSKAFQQTKSVYHISFIELSELNVKAELSICFAVVHHLFFSALCSFEKIAQVLHKSTEKYLLIEWIDLKDEMVQKISFAERAQHYSEQAFNDFFAPYFSLKEQHKLKSNVHRTLFLFEKVDIFATPNGEVAQLVRAQDS